MAMFAVVVLGRQLYRFVCVKSVRFDRAKGSAEVSRYLFRVNSPKQPSRSADCLELPTQPHTGMLVIW